jgi:hypothetical protein
MQLYPLWALWLFKQVQLLLLLTADSGFKGVSVPELPCLPTMLWPLLHVQQIRGVPVGMVKVRLQ